MRTSTNLRSRLSSVRFVIAAKNSVELNQVLLAEFDGMRNSMGQLLSGAETRKRAMAAWNQPFSRIHACEAGSREFLANCSSFERLLRRISS